MDKLAKVKRRIGLLNKLKEDFSPFGKAIEGLDSELSLLMDKLRETDDNAREIAVNLKPALKAARSYYNRKEYLTAAIYLSKFHDELEKIIQTFGDVKNFAEMKHQEFLFGDLDSENKEYLLKNMPTKFNKKREKKAGLADWWHNVSTPRGDAMRAYEKRFPKSFKELKMQTEKIVSKSELFLKKFNIALKTLAKFRADRKLENYVSLVESIEKSFNEYDKSFAEYYHKYIDRLVKMQEAVNQKAPAEVLPSTGQEILEENKEVVNQDPDPTEKIVMPDLPIENTQLLKSPQQHTVVVPPAPKSGPRPVDHSEEKIIEEVKVVDEAPKKPLVNLPFPTKPTSLPTTVKGPVNLTFPNKTNPKNKPSNVAVPTDTDTSKSLEDAIKTVAPKKPVVADIQIFLHQLNKLSDQSPQIIAKEINKFAESIRNIDPELSQQLFNIVKLNG